MGQFEAKLWKSITGFFLVVLICVATSYAYSIKPRWFSKLYQIDLMVTKKDEVERLFDFPTITYTSKWENRSNTIEYRIKEGKLSVTYSLGRCSDINREGYDVNKDVVIGIDLRLNKQAKISELGLNLRMFDKREISDLSGVFTYANEDFSERFTGTSEKITDFTRSPSKSEQSLKCKMDQ